MTDTKFIFPKRLSLLITWSNQNIGMESKTLKIHKVVDLPLWPDWAECSLAPVHAPACQHSPWPSLMLAATPFSHHLALFGLLLLPEASVWSPVTVKFMHCAAVCIHNGSHINEVPALDGDYVYNFLKDIKFFVKILSFLQKVKSKHTKKEPHNIYLVFRTWNVANNV